MEDKRHNTTFNKVLNVISAWIVSAIALVPIIATFLCAVALMYYGANMTAHLVTDLVQATEVDHASHGKNLLAAIEVVDVFLLAIVVLVISLGLFQLFFGGDASLPDWLVIKSLDALKAKLIGVIVTMLSVSFLGQVLVWHGEVSIAYLGGGVALVIYALTRFLKQMH